MADGWSRLLAEPWPRGDGAFPLPAYSDFMPAPLVGWKPSGEVDPDLRLDGDEYGWRIPARDELHELGPGLASVAAALAPRLDGLVDADPTHRGLSRDLVDGNPYLPPRGRRGPLIAIVSLALSRTQDDKGRVRWTLLGGSDLGPADGFWSGFARGPDRRDQDSDDDAAAKLAPLIAPFVAQRALTARPRVASLLAAGVRIVPIGPDPDDATAIDEPIPRALARLVIRDRAITAAALATLRVVITFRAYPRLPAALRKAVEAGRVVLVPSPEALVGFGHRGYRRLAAALPAAMQLPLLRALPEGLRGLRVPQSGWIDQLRSGGPHTHGALRERVKRTHRWQRVRRDDDDHAAVAYDDHVADALFATGPDQLGLYDKPMARNAQVWTDDYRLVLDGPRANRERLAEAARTIAAGGHFGYRFQWPPMRVGRREVIWHRPLCFIAADGEAPRVIESSRGVLIARRDGAADVRLWPRADDRAPWIALERGFAAATSHEARHDVRKLLDARARLGAPLAPTFATRLVSAARDARWDRWLAALPERATDPAAAAIATRAVTQAVAAADPPPRAAITYGATATRDFERRYWDAIAALSTEAWRTKNNADRCAPSGPGARDLDGLADELARRHRATIERHAMVGRAAVGHHWFRWDTDFDFPWSEGWARNQLHGPRERNVLCVIPGRDRTRAVVLADHYDTAYMEDVYDGAVAGHGKGVRAASHGADDNHSATAALLLAADVLLPLAKAGQLERDVWLVHLTGEEFPGDSLGARHLVRRLIEQTLRLDDASGGKPIDLARVQLDGVVVMDMIAHRDPRAGYGFQIAPGEGARAMAVALATHDATERWNAGAVAWNRGAERARARPYRRRAEGTKVPDVAPHAQLVGELRPHWHWSSTVFNTDAQAFSDAGLPIVLLMEHYDIDRRGYHDTLDTLANIDLDYGAAIAAVAIETIAALATAR